MDEGPVPQELGWAARGKGRQLVGRPLSQHVIDLQKVAKRIVQVFDVGGPGDDGTNGLLDEAIGNRDGSGSPSFGKDGDVEPLFRVIAQAVIRDEYHRSRGRDVMRKGKEGERAEGSVGVGVSREKGFADSDSVSPAIVGDAVRRDPPLLLAKRAKGLTTLPAVGE